MVFPVAGFSFLFPFCMDAKRENVIHETRAWGWRAQQRDKKEKEIL